MKDLEIHIPGQPFAQKRHRSKKNGHTWDPSANDKETIQKALLFYKPTRLLTGAIILTIQCYFQTPKSWSDAKKERYEGTYRMKTPDWDNSGKIYCDAMNGMIYNDDKQVVRGTVEDRYSMNPRTIIRIKEIQLNR